MLHQVKIVVCVNGREAAADHEYIAVPDEDGLHAREFLRKLVFHETGSG